MNAEIKLIKKKILICHKCNKKFKSEKDYDLCYKCAIIIPRKANNVCLITDD